jgi:CMP-N-acetylneuraminic acid synthetase
VHGKRGETWAFIGARGGSKGIPGKNLADLGGRPLISYTIEAARRARIDRVLVSTDSPEIARVAREWGADVPFLRPARLAGDAAHISDARDYTLRRIRRTERRRPRILVALFPTHPFRGPALIDKVIARLSDAPRAVTCTRVLLDPRRLLSGRLRPLSAEGRPVPVVHPRGVVIADRWTGSRPAFRGVFACVALVPIDDPVEAIDIDVPEDLELAREVLRRGLFRRGGAAPPIPQAR